jgi:hypothetical protein
MAGTRDASVRETMKKVLLAVVLLAACDDDDDPAVVDAGLDAAPLTSCPGEPPALATCTQAHFSATCGDSEGAPRLACQGRDCVWFTNGCVAEGFLASDCAADDICCHEGWPYAGTDEPVDLGHNFYAYGTEPWDPARFRVLGVDVDPTLTVPGTAFTCEGDDLTPGTTTPCGKWPFEVQARLGDTLRLYAVGTNGGGVAGWRPWIEVITLDNDAGHLARLCAARFVDVSEPYCSEVPELVCASEGTIRLNRLPASQAELSGLAVEIDVLLKDLHLTGTLAVP